MQRLPKTISNMEDGSQLVRSSGSIGANYLEASEGISKKDAICHLKIARKEAKESIYWLRLVDTGGHPQLEKERGIYQQEATEILRILSAILHKLEQPSCS